VIVTKLQGGHGNQLFQYATGRCLAMRLGVALFMDRRWFGTIGEGDTPRVYELDRYKLDQSFFDPESFTLVEIAPRPSGLRRFLSRTPSKPWLEHYRQQGDGFDPRVLDLPDNSYLVGWWQDERYFGEIRATLLEEIELSDPLTGSGADWLRQIRNSVSVSLHVRRGDYVTNPATTKFHGVLGVPYYEAAVDRLAELTRRRDLELFVFSNDIEWCKRHLGLPYPATFVESGGSGADDMRLMKHCRHHIVANSSFSWWGAWLSDHPEKVVIAPKNWFSDAQANAETEIVPRSWVRL
jgi:Glycosyl transferase family 11